MQISYLLIIRDVVDGLTKMPQKASELKRKLDAWLVESGAIMPEPISRDIQL